MDIFLFQARKTSWPPHSVSERFPWYDTAKSGDQGLMSPSITTDTFGAVPPGTTLGIKSSVSTNIYGSIPQGPSNNQEVGGQPVNRANAASLSDLDALAIYSDAQTIATSISGMSNHVGPKNQSSSSKSTTTSGGNSSSNNSESHYQTMEEMATSIMPPYPYHHTMWQSGRSQPQSVYPTTTLMPR